MFFYTRATDKLRVICMKELSSGTSSSTFVAECHSDSKSINLQHPGKAKNVSHEHGVSFGMGGTPLRLRVTRIKYRLFSHRFHELATRSQ